MTSPIVARRFETYVCSVERAPRRRLVAPDPLDERVDRDDPPKLANQQPERGALFRATERNQYALARDLDRAKDPDVHVATIFLVTLV